MPRLTINVPYEVLEKIMKAYPNLPPEEAIKQYLVETALRGKEVELPKARSGLEAFATGAKERAVPVKCVTHEDLVRLRRSLEDLLNPVTGKIDSLRSQFATVYEAMEKIIEKLEELSKKVEQAPTVPHPRATVPAARVEEGGQAHPRRRRTSAIEILKEQKVMYESDIASKIKNRDAFFERLKRDGAIVLELTDQRVAVDPEYWQEFLKRLEEINTNSEPELEKALGKRGYQLLKALMRSTLAYFDATERKWKLMLEETS